MCPGKIGLPTEWRKATSNEILHWHPFWRTRLVQNRCRLPMTNGWAPKSSACQPNGKKQSPMRSCTDTLFEDTGFFKTDAGFEWLMDESWKVGLPTEWQKMNFKRVPKKTNKNRTDQKSWSLGLGGGSSSLSPLSTTDPMQSRPHPKPTPPRQQCAFLGFTSKAFGNSLMFWNLLFLFLFFASAVEKKKSSWLCNEQWYDRGLTRQS